MNYFMGRIPLMLEIIINGFFVLVYTFQKSGKLTHILAKLPMNLIIAHAIWAVPLVLFISLASNFLKSEGFEDFFRRYVFSLIIFIPLIITWGDIEFIY